jgi:hypothetical protein
MDEQRKDGDGNDVSHEQRRKPRPGDPDHPGMKNLRPWPKGVSGNPGGQPKGKGPSLVKAIRELLDQPADVLKNTKLEGRTVRDVLAAAAVQNAIKGRSAYFREILNRLHGRVAVRVEQKQIPSDEDVRPEIAAAGIAAMLKAAKEGTTEE